MKNKIKRVLFKNVNVAYLLIAFIVSVGLWFIVVNVDDPSQTKNFTATVKVENEDVLTDAGKYYTLKYDDKVTFRVTGKRSVIEKLSSDDFVVVADMKNLENDERIPIEITPTKYANSITVSSKAYYLEVTIGQMMDNQFDVTPTTEGDVAEGYAVSRVESNPTSVVINGPQEIVSRIDSVRAVMDVSGLTETSSKSVSLQLYDKSNNLLDTSQLTLSHDKVVVTATIQMIKTVNIKVETTGKLADGLTLDSISTDPESIEVVGDASNINSLTSITIPSSVVNLSDITENFTTTVDISTYLPKGVSLKDSEKATVTVKVVLASKESKTFKVPTSNINIDNIADGCEAKFSDNTVSVKITGTESALKKLSAEDITGSVDASGLAKGDHTVSIKLNLDNDLDAESVTTKITITSTED